MNKGRLHSLGRWEAAFGFELRGEPLRAEHWIRCRAGGLVWVRQHKVDQQDASSSTSIADSQSHAVGLRLHVVSDPVQQQIDGLAGGPCDLGGAELVEAPGFSGA